MVIFDKVSKAFRTSAGLKPILSDVSAELPAGAKIGVLGLNGAGKSTLLRLIAGAELPDSGRVIRRSRVSFPVGFSGTFHPEMTGRGNVKFLAKIYGADVRQTVEWVDDFAELGTYYDMPVATYSSGMFARLAFGMSFALTFDVYLVDEAIEVGDQRFRRKCVAAFRGRIKDASLIMVSHHIASLREYCQSGAVLHGGRLTWFERLDDATVYYEDLIRGGH